MINLKKQVVLILALLLSSLYAEAQDSVAGSWYGSADVGGMKLRIVFHIEQVQDSLRATMDSPDQKAIGIPVHSVKFADSTLLIEMPSIYFTFKGKLTSQQDSIKGNVLQRMRLIPLSLSRNKIEAARRPQDPVEPYPYKVEEVVFESIIEDIRFAGTLTLPEKSTGKCAAVVLVSGSGASDRDESMMGHRPFLVLADYLTRNGIAVLRYDKRGVGGSTGNLIQATTANFSHDALAAVRYLRSRSDIDSTKIGMIGHSEGGLITSMVAYTNKTVKFIVLLASPGVPGDALLLMQNEAIGRASGMSKVALAMAKNINHKLYNMVIMDAPESDILKYLMSNPAMSEQQAKEIIKQITSAWFKTFLVYEPAIYLEMTTCPVLALNGTKDLQVPYKENLSEIQKALTVGGNKNFKVEALDGLNHLFQECGSGLPNEYASIEQTFSPVALEKITSWIVSICGNDL